MDTHFLKLTLQYKEESLDLALAREMTVRRLLKDLAVIFSWELDQACSQIYVANKGLILTQADSLKHASLGNGDVFIIESRKEDERETRMDGIG